MRDQLTNLTPKHLFDKKCPNLDARCADVRHEGEEADQNPDEAERIAEEVMDSEKKA